ncbi:glucose-6-phosphate dehydrogenase [Glacieibacterium megasporae]|uniref:glucose-6-phosphate dehydrogenase n=1 Tax=Glacieibacterium megasporae TaxID=2835787 RepID=UPI001C1E475F|nr:glucose-6-phosphate dehydrogenase [Polymorphobacter megasporae]UAJ10540.1 glucose-6-phosphate dehydrogenase [Polymorphobacter megasporae]
MTGVQSAPSATIVIFGALGDLARRLLSPALVNLACAGLLAHDTLIIGVARADGNDQTLRDALDQFVENESDYSHLRNRIVYIRGDFDDPATFTAIADRCLGNAIFYLATPASYFEPFADRLAVAGLLDESRGFRRIIIEKPFGADLASAQALNRKLLEHADEQQIYRIDHFLGKETVQNLMVLRFGNTLFDAAWDYRHVDHIQITAAETVTIGSRGKFYDATGALRDMVPNHLFQLMTLVGMEPPTGLDSDAIQDAKAAFGEAVRPVPASDAIRARYGAGMVGSEAVAAYVDADGVDPAGVTETYAALKVRIDTPRWAGVPFYLRTGKALAARDTTIVIQYREALPKLFDHGGAPADRLILQIQPNEGIQLEFVAKTPGPTLAIAPIVMDFRYAKRFPIDRQTGYETLLYDALVGDRTLFSRADHVEAGWRMVAELQAAWAAEDAPAAYSAGSAGPFAADTLLSRDARHWYPLR